MVLENIFLILGMSTIVVGIYLILGLGVSLIGGGVCLIVLATLIGRSNAYKKFTEGKCNGKTSGPDK